MNYKKTTFLPLKENLGDNFLNEKFNIIINEGKEFSLELNPNYMISPLSPHSKNSTFSDNIFTYLMKNIDLKNILCNAIKDQKIKPEMVLLFIKTEDKIIMLNDYEIIFCYNSISHINNSNFNSGLNSEMRSTGLHNLKKVSTNLSLNNINYEHNNPIIYYKICNYTQKVMIDIFKNEIEKIILNIPITCSIYMLKKLIFEKLKIKNVDLKNYKLYGVGFIDSENIKFINKAMTNKKFTDELLIYDIMKYYMEPNKCVNKILNLILIEKTSEQCSIGLDFRFNLLRNFQKLENYDLNAPSYRNVSDGLNLFIYCLNEKCSHFNNYFTVCKGYGTFNIFNLIKNIKCPFCNLKKFSLRNLGMINAKWVYQFYLKGTKESKINGEGITFENGKLYIIKEIIFENQFYSLFIEVEYYQNKNFLNLNNRNSFQSSIQNIESSFFYSSNEISESDLNNINLEQKYLKKHNNNNKNSFELEVETELTFEKKEDNKKTEIINNNINKEENYIINLIENSEDENINKNNINIYSSYKNNVDNKLNENNINDNDNDNEIIKHVEKKESNNIKKNNKINNCEIDIKLDYKKEQCCIGCGKMAQNSFCILW